MTAHDDDDLTVQRHVEWPPEELVVRGRERKHSCERDATLALTPAARGTSTQVPRRVERAPRILRPAPSTQPRPASTSPSLALRVRVFVERRRVLFGLGICGLLMSAFALPRLRAGEAIAERPAARAETNEAASPAAAVDAPHPPPPPRSAHASSSVASRAPAAALPTPNSAADALCKNDYDRALAAYGALAELHPQAPVYGVVASVLARKLSRCGQGAPCVAP
jgi:hypothetical protein